MNDSSPSIAGILALDSGPTASTQNRAVTTSPVSVRTCQAKVASSRTMLITRVPNEMSRRRSKRSAT